MGVKGITLRQEVTTEFSNQIAIVVARTLDVFWVWPWFAAGLGILCGAATVTMMLTARLSLRWGSVRLPRSIVIFAVLLFLVSTLFGMYYLTMLFFVSGPMTSMLYIGSFIVTIVGFLVTAFLLLDTSF